MSRDVILSKVVKTALAAIGATLAGAVLAQPAGPPSVFASAPAGSARPPLIDANDPACRPAYPPEALAAHAQGESHLRFRVDAAGRLVSGQMLRNADAPPEQRMLDVAALAALSRCPIKPGIDAEGKPAGGDVDITYRWVLDAPPAVGEGRLQGMTPSCRPEYPPAAVRSGAQGTTGLAFHVDETGKVTGVDIVKHSGDTREHHLLDAAAAHFLSLCPVQPARDADGKPVASVVKVAYTWRLDAPARESDLRVDASIGAPHSLPAGINANDPACALKYPPAAFAARAQGDTRVQFDVGPDGRLLAARVVQSAGPTPEHHLLDDAAVAALSRCPLRPGTDASGNPIGGKVTVVYHWMIDPLPGAPASAPRLTPR